MYRPSAWAEKGLVEFDHIKIVQVQAAGAASSFLCGWNRPDSHDPGRHAGHGHSKDANFRRQARGGKLPSASLANSNAAAPSLMPEAFPAVTVPSGNNVLNWASFSNEVSRGCSSRINNERILFAPGYGYRANFIRPGVHAVHLRSCCFFLAPQGRTGPDPRGLMEKSSARCLRCFRHDVRAVHLAFSLRLMKRHPMVVSYISCVRPKAPSALPMTNGDRDMLSTPPAIISSPWPDANRRGGAANRVQARAAQAVDGASRNFQPASRPASLLMRPTFRLSFPRLVGATQQDIVQLCRPFDVPGCVPSMRTDRNGCEVIGPNGSEAAAIAPNGSANAITNEYVGHIFNPVW